MKNDFQNKSVLITGASSGIGAALARELAARGALLALTARRTDRLKALQDELAAKGTRVIVIAGDVTRDEDLKAAAREIRKAFGKIDVVIANAGFGVVGNVETLSIDDYRRQFETNVYGVIRTVQATLEDLKASRGRLVLIGSVSGYVALGGSSPYSMSKFAVRALGESLDYELKRFGVSTTVINPGFVSSEIRKVDNQGAFHEVGAEPVPAWLLYPTEKAARKIADAIARRKVEQVITGHGKLAVFLKRHCPALTRYIVGRGIRGRGQPGAKQPH